MRRKLHAVQEKPASNAAFNPRNPFIEFLKLSELFCKPFTAEDTLCYGWKVKNETSCWELLITYCATRIGSCGAQRTLRTHPLLKSATGHSLRLLEVPCSSTLVNMRFFRQESFKTRINIRVYLIL